MPEQFSGGIEPMGTTKSAGPDGIKLKTSSYSLKPAMACLCCAAWRCNSQWHRPKTQSS